MNGIVMEVEVYLGSRTGPPRLQVALPGGMACQGKRCKVVGPNGIVRLAGAGLTPDQPSREMTEREQEESRAWSRYLQESEKLPPDPSAPPIPMPPPAPLPLQWSPPILSAPGDLVGAVLFGMLL